MKNLKKITLFVGCVATTAMMYFVGQQKTMASSIVSDNVEALVQDEAPNVLWIKSNLCTKNSNGTSGGYLDVSKDIRPVEDLYFCAGNAYPGDELNTKCWIIIELPF